MNEAVEAGSNNALATAWWSQGPHGTTSAVTIKAAFDADELWVVRLT
jgi:hypothetical protein